MKKNTLWIIIGLVAVIGLVLILTQNKPTTEISETTSSPEVPLEETGETTPMVEEKTPIEIAFDNAQDVEIASEKAKGVDAVLRPVLHNVFDVVVDDQTISGVKMTEEFGPMLTYIFNRKLTEAERDAIINGLEQAGVEVVDQTANVYTVKKDNAMWVITFYLNNDQKSGLEITF
jgi:hypothetical protein